ncbi:Yip1 family protein [Oceanirhabdus seepicola]|uniref:YIP1 family protein n=1 Tax=Oceanirhabdus seepicola TaxID=2828781 RepID=A0A9J6P8G5_9CLOT|nr:Yip1 family protein [Oceanirhabdus seepicola]MCM1992217.1 YIP1 family protein [Oceanirhabdus seepicola]
MSKFENERNSTNAVKKINPWFSIWIEPKKTIRYIVNNDIKGFIIILAMLSGIMQSLNIVSSSNLSNIVNFNSTISVIIMFVACIYLGSIGGILSLYLFSGIIKWIGKSLGGQAEGDEIRAAIAYGSVPFIMTSALSIPALLVFSKYISTNYSWFILFAIIQFVGSIWTIVVGLNCLGEVQGFSVWKALINKVLAGLIILISILALTFIGLYGVLSYMI